MNLKTTAFTIHVELGKILLIKIFVLILACMTFDKAQASEPLKFYVSVNGSDANSGTQEQPFSSLEAAKIAVRNFKNKSVNFAQPIEIIIGGGVYYLDKALELEPEDSGSKSAIIIWRAAENERVILSGGKAITGK